MPNMIFSWEVNSRASNGTEDSGISEADWDAMSGAQRNDVLADMLANFVSYGMYPAGE